MGDYRRRLGAGGNGPQGASLAVYPTTYGQEELARALAAYLRSHRPAASPGYSSRSVAPPDLCGDAGGM